jgi:hypothetical protein
MQQIFDQPIDLDTPDFVIPLRNIQSPTDVYNFCRTNNISHFGYGFRFVRNSYLTEQLKFGFSAPEPNARAIQKGERLVRQIAWLPGWNVDVSSSHGFEFWHGCTSLIAQEILPNDTNYTDIEIAIWSATLRTNISSYSLTKRECAEFIESELCQQYKSKHNTLPKLNLVDPTLNKTHKILTKSTLLDLFDFTNLN